MCKERVREFVDNWFNIHKPKIEKIKWVDPRAKYEYYKSYSNKRNAWISAYCTVGDNVSNISKYRWKFMGRLKSFNLYKFFTESYQSVVEVKKVDHTNANLKTLIKKANNVNYKEVGLPLPVNKNSKIIGVFKGTLPHKVDSRHYFEDGLVDQVFNKYDRELLANKEVRPGSWKYSCSNLETMASLKTKKFSTDELIDGLFSRVNIDFELPFIKRFSFNMINGILTKGEAFSGLLTSKLFGSKKKQTTGFFKTFCKEYYEFIIKRNEFVYDMSLSMVGGREKRVTLTENYKELKTRVVIMCEDIPTLIGQVISYPLTKGFQRLNSGFSFIGRSMEQRNFMEITNEVDCDLINTISFNADFSGHDNYCDENQIVVAFAVLRLCFPRHWKFMDKLCIFNVRINIQKSCFT